MLVESQGQKLVCGTGREDRNTIFCLDRTTLQLKRQIKLPGFVWGLASYRGVIYVGLPQDGKVFSVPLDREVLKDLNSYGPVGSPSRLFAGELIGSGKAILLVPLISGFRWAEIDKQDPASVSVLGFSGFANERGYAFNQVVPGALDDGRGALFLVGRDGVEVYSLEDRFNLFPRFRVETVFDAVAFLPEWGTVFALTEGKVVRWRVGHFADPWLVGGFADELPVCGHQPYLGVTLLLDPRPTHRGSFWLSCPAEDRVVYYDYNGEAKWQANGEKPTGLTFDQDLSRLFVSFKDRLAAFEVSE